MAAGESAGCGAGGSVPRRGAVPFVRSTARRAASYRSSSRRHERTRLTAQGFLLQRVAVCLSLGFNRIASGRTAGGVSLVSLHPFTDVMCASQPVQRTSGVCPALPSAPCTRRAEPECVPRGACLPLGAAGWRGCVQRACHQGPA